MATFIFKGETLETTGNGFTFISSTGVKIFIDSQDQIDNLGLHNHDVTPILPLHYFINQVVKLRFRPDDKPFSATVRCIHFYNNQIKYDLGLWLGDGSVDNPETETRIYNVDPKYTFL